MNEDLKEQRDELVNQCTDIMAEISSRNCPERAPILQKASTIMKAALEMDFYIPLNSELAISE